MSEIFELFGYPLTDHTQEAEHHRKAARCPYMGAECDGGGNRYLSRIRLEDPRTPQALRDYYPGRSSVQAGVCSLQLHPNEQPWIVCPRRLLFLGKSNINENQAYQQFVENSLFEQAGFASRTVLGCWPEVKMKYKASGRSFDYTFDYVVMQLGSITQRQAELATGIAWAKLRPLLEDAGYTLAKRDQSVYIENFPVQSPAIVEIMTSSTSGGNRAKGTTISLAFQDAVLGRHHKGPGINYRQVWGRMVSQLVAKSEIGINWGGKTFWILQDVLVDYISSSTGIDIHQFVAEQTSEVNMLCFSYGEARKATKGPIELRDGVLYSGPISASEASKSKPSFQDMLRAPLLPAKKKLLALLARRGPASQVMVP